MFEQFILNVITVYTLNSKVFSGIYERKFKKNVYLNVFFFVISLYQ